MHALEVELQNSQGLWQQPCDKFGMYPSSDEKGSKQAALMQVPASQHAWYDMLLCSHGRVAAYKALGCGLPTPSRTLGLSRGTFCCATLAGS